MQTHLHFLCGFCLPSLKGCIQISLLNPVFWVCQKLTLHVRLNGEKDYSASKRQLPGSLGLRARILFNVTLGPFAYIRCRLSPYTFHPIFATDEIIISLLFERDIEGLRKNIKCLPRVCSLRETLQLRSVFLPSWSHLSSLQPMQAGRQAGKKVSCVFRNLSSLQTCDSLTICVPNQLCFCNLHGAKNVPVLYEAEARGKILLFHWDQAHGPPRASVLYHNWAVLTFTFLINFSGQFTFPLLLYLAELIIARVRWLQELINIHRQQ